MPAGIRAQSVADSAWAVGDIALAERLYSAELADGGASGRTLHRLALIRAWADELDESLDLLDALVSEDPTNVEAALDRARVLSWSDDLPGAAAAYRQILIAHPESRDARLGLARVLSWDGDTDAAEAEYGAILEADPRDPEALAGHARVAGWDGRLEEAETRWRAALDTHPNDVALLTGLAATLRWAGRSSEAVEVVERALELDPDHRDARLEYRLARLSVAPRLGPTLVYEHDSDGNRILTLYYDQSLRPTRWLSLNGQGYGRTSGFEQTGETGQSYGGLVETRFRIGSGWEVETGVGVHENTLGPAGPKPQLRLRVATPGSLPVQAWARYWRRGLDETTALMRNDVTVDETSAGIRGNHGMWRGEASASLTSYRSSTRNTRRGVVVGVTRRLGAEWSLGATARLFGFDEDRNDGYFDPDRFGLLEFGVGWAHEVGAWQIGLSVSPGIQRVGLADAAVSAAFRGRASVGYEFGPGQLLTLHAGYSSAGLRSFSTGEADYRYMTLALAAGWAF